MMNMKSESRFAAALLAAVLLCCMMFPAGSALADQTGTVHGGWLILRASPSFNGTIISSYPNGTVVTIKGKTGSWYSVVTPDGRKGYMLSDYLTVGGSPVDPSGETAYVTSANGLNVRLRTGPGLGYNVIAAYAPGTPCTILSPGNNWCRIQIGGVVGYMMTVYLTYSPVVPTPQPSGGDEYIVYVTSRNGLGVNLRSGPGKGYTSIGFYSVGTPAVMVSAGTPWSYIRVGSRTGYMMSEFLTTEDPSGSLAPLNPTAYVVSANGRNVNLRSAPTTSSAVITAFKVGTPLTIITRGTDWYFIQIGGYYGYMMRQFIYDGLLYATPTDLHF